MHMRSCCVVDSGELVLTRENIFEHSLSEGPFSPSLSNRFHCFHRLHENENVLKTFQNTLKCVSISFRLGIVFGRCRGSSKRSDFVPFRSYFVVV